MIILCCYHLHHLDRAHESMQEGFPSKPKVLTWTLAKSLSKLTDGRVAILHLAISRDPDGRVSVYTLPGLIGLMGMIRLVINVLGFVVGT